jgi:16S rRNA (uracil1498-N3)-methyltransferase
MPRFFTPQHLSPGSTLELEAAAARHVQVLRMQPGDNITLFNGLGDTEGEYTATVYAMGRSNVSVVVGTFVKTHTDPLRAVHLAIGMPANDRMDWLVEKATELGITSIQPLTTERSVLRLSAERAEKKLAHWHGVTVAACEQCGRSRVPVVHAPMNLTAYLTSCLEAKPVARSARLVLSLQAGTLALASFAETHDAFTLLSGPEGGLSPAEEACAHASGFLPITLGSRVLRSETAPLAALAHLQLLCV